MARTANEELYDAAIKRKIYLLRFADGEAKRIADLLAAIERDILEKIAGKLASDFSAARLESLLTSVKDLQAAGLTDAARVVNEAMAELAVQEAHWETTTIKRVSPVNISLASVQLETLHALAGDPVQGLSISRWFEGIASQTVQNIERELRLGIAQGETLSELVARIQGTRKNSFKDGVFNTTRNDAQAIVRTAVTSVSTSAREQVWQANADVILCLRWTSVLDGRTTPICMSRDGHVAPVDVRIAIPEEVHAERLEPPTARPPAHINCRSIMVAVLDANGIVGNRPYVGDDRVRSQREADFRQEARDRGVSIQQVRSEWANEQVGQLPAKTTYEEFFARQSEDFQRSVLGPSRFQLYKKGTPLGGFVDNAGHQYTLEELRQRY